MIRCAALAKLREDRDLWLLPEVVDDVEWLATGALVSTDRVAIVTGTWIAAHPEAARALFDGRATAGRTTLVLPNFRRGDLGPVLSAPARIEVRAADADDVAWTDGEHYSVPSVCQLHTPLHAGRWASAGNGAAVLCYRRRTGDGATVICTAVIASRASGVRRPEQRRLAERIFSAVATEERTKPLRPAEEPPGEPPDLDGFLAESGATGALLLLSLLACGGDRAADLSGAAADRLGARIDPGRVAELLARVPSADAGQIAAALRRQGWGAYLRRLFDELPATGDAA